MSRNHIDCHREYIVDIVLSTSGISRYLRDRHTNKHIVDKEIPANLIGLDMIGYSIPIRRHHVEVSQILIGQRLRSLDGNYDIVEIFEASDRHALSISIMRHICICYRIFGRVHIILELLPVVLRDHSESFDKANELIPQATELLKELDNSLVEQGAKLKLSEKKIDKMENLIKELSGEEASMVEAFLTYKNNLTVYLETKMSVMESYETFLSQISSDIAFRDMELMITSLNTNLKALTAAYEEYEQSAYDFSTKYEEVLGK